MSELKLRPYQMDGVDKIREAFKRGYRRVIVAAACGSGKSELAAYLLQASQLKNKKSMFLVDRIVLGEQISNRLTKYAIRHGVIQASNPKFNPNALTQIASAQTLESRGYPDVQLLIVDECHASRAGTAKMIADGDMHVIGLSASPVTDGLSKIYETVVNLTTTNKLIKDGFLVAPTVYIAEAEVDTASASIVAGEYNPADIERSAMQICGDIVVETMNIIRSEFNGVIPKMIVFSPSVAYGAQVVERFAAVGVNLVNISYKTKQDEKTAILADFEREDSLIHGLVSCDVLSKGFDNTRIALGLSIRCFRKSLAQHIQQIGRIMRVHPDKDKAVWIDFSGNYLRFREDLDDIFENGITSLKDGKEKPKTTKDEKEKAEAKCPACHRLWAGGLICVHCGAEKKIRNAIIEVPGKVMPLDKKGSTGFLSESEFYANALWKVQEGVWTSARAFATFRATFGKPPPVGITPSQPTELFDKAILEATRRYLAKKNILENYKNKKMGLL